MKTNWTQTTAWLSTCACLVGFSSSKWWSCFCELVSLQVSWPFRDAVVFLKWNKNRFLNDLSSESDALCLKLWKLVEKFLQVCVLNPLTGNWICLGAASVHVGAAAENQTHTSCSVDNKKINKNPPLVWKWAAINNMDTVTRSAWFLLNAAGCENSSERFGGGKLSGRLRSEQTGFLQIHGDDETFC